MKRMKNDGQLNVRLPEDVLKSLLKIESAHGMTANEVLRRLAIAAADFYNENGWFSFPVTITPEIFQSRPASELNMPVPKNRTVSASVPTEHPRSKLGAPLLTNKPRR